MASATVASNVIVLEALNKHNYKDWSSRVETYLLSKDLWDIVKSEPLKAENGEAEYKAWRTKNAKALHAIKISCGTEIFYLIRETSIAKTAWEILEKASKSKATLLHEEQERTGSLTANNAGQMREVGKESLLADEELELKASEGGNEKNVNYEYNPSYNPFFNYVIRGDWDHAKECLATIHPDAVRARRPGDGCTALQLAAWEGHVHIVKELTSLMTQEDLEIKDDEGDTALHSAVYLGRVNVVKELVSSMRQQGLRIKNNSGATPLHVAAQKGHVHIIIELTSLMAQEDLKIKDNDGCTALHKAVIKRNVDIVKQLVPLMRPEGLGIKNNNGKTALHIATRLGQVNMVKELVSLMREEDLEIRDVNYAYDPSYNPFFKYVSGGDWGHAKDCLATIHPDAVRARRPGDGCTALELAAWEGHVHIVKELTSLMTQEDLEIEDNDGDTALHSAVYLGRVNVVKELVSSMRQQCFQIRNSSGATPLHVAAKKGHLHIIKELTSLMAQEDLEIKDNDGCTALHKAVIKRNVDIVKQLVPLMRPEGLGIKNNNGQTALHFATRLGQVNMVKELVSLMREEDLEIQDNDGYTALYRAFIQGNVDIVKQLVALMRPEGLGIKSNNGQTALHFATVFGHVDIVKELVSLMRAEDLEIQDNDGYTALYSAFIQGNVDIVKQLVALMRPEGLGIRSNNGETALHFATVFGHVDIVKELVSLMRAEDLEIRDYVGYTALSNTLYLDQSEEDIVQIARDMVEKNENILCISSSRKNFIPVVEAFGLSKWQTFRFLYSVTPREALLAENRTQGAQLISTCIRLGKELDVASDLLQRYPRLAIVDDGFGSPPMLELAHVRYAFAGGKQLTFLQKWVYNSIHIQPVDFDLRQISIDVSKFKDDQGNQRDPICSAMSLYRRFVKGHLAKLLGMLKDHLAKLLRINHMYEMKSTHIRVNDFLSCMGGMTRSLSTFTLAEMNVVTSSIFKAVEQGHVEFVIHLCKANPSLLDISDEKDRDIFRYAIECRQEGIYNLFYGLETKKRNKIGLSVDKFNNSMLHCAANLSPLTSIQGASLKMQRELQWFKEVESIVPVEMHGYLNFSDGLTAHELFTKNHKKLMKEAEISMKGTASSCTTIGALIVTIMFAVAFTVPGGNSGNTGLPTFMHKKLFRVFIVSDTISLVSSSTSVITFLGILTSRYAEDDFLKSLPKKMVVGISTLFISIATMMITFFCALTIMLDVKAWIIVPSIMFASVPIISFVWLLFPLLVEICLSTPGIFDRKIKPWY